MTNLHSSTLLISFIIIGFIGCSTNDSGDSDLTLEDIIPNSTWYNNAVDNEDQDFADVYNTVEFGDLNNTVTFSDHDFPCGTDAYYIETAEYTILDGPKLLLEYEDGENFAFDIESFSTDKIVIYVEEDDNYVTLKKNCQDL